MTMLSRSQDLLTYQTPLDKISDREVGGKAWNLFRLRHFGFPVPPWCVLSSRVFDNALARPRVVIEKIVDRVDFTDAPALEEAASRIKEIIFDSPFQVAEILNPALADLFPSRAFLSIRSSVVGEDSSDHSFAGQMDSFLNVPKSNIEDAVRSVWASAFSSRALVYRKRKGINLTRVSTAVIVQEMVQALSAGVLFTRDPESKEKKLVISAAYGLGEGVVADKVESDTYRVDWDGSAISRDVPVKTSRIAINPSERGGTRLEPVPVEMSARPVLNDSRLEQLRALGIKAEAAFGVPQDVEWAFDDQGKLFILQSRPIVFTQCVAAAVDVRIWDNSNIIESYPGLTLPLTFSFARGAYESTFRNEALSFLLFKKHLQRRFPIFNNMIGLLDGRVYYNLRNWYEMLSYLPGFNKHKRSWDEMIGIAQTTEFPEGRLSPINRLYALAMAGWKVLALRRTAKKFFARFGRAYTQVEHLDLSAATESELADIYESFTAELAEHWHLTLDNDFSAMTYYAWLKKLCASPRLSKYPNLCHDLLCGESGVESVAPIRSLVALAEMVGQDPSYRALIGHHDEREVWQKIQAQPEHSALRAGLERHLRMFGDRGLEDLKLDSPSLREQPELLVSLVRSYLHSGLTAAGMERREQEIRIQAEKFVARNLTSPVKRLLFCFVLRNARRAIANRENMRFARSRVFGVIKRLFRRLGEIFTQKGLLDSPSDIHYLTVDEVLGFIRGTAVTQNLKALVQLRKSEYANFGQRAPQERVQTRGIPYLNGLDRDAVCTDTAKKLRGIGCSSGIAAGAAQVISDPRLATPTHGRILVAKSTDPGWVFLMVSSNGMLVEKGSVLSHTAIIGRELGIPTVVGAKDATKLIPDGARLSINGTTGEAWWQ
ncbi:MAG TPA: PEP/pyruvate-binding domain-containing protein [Candidatus Acidoferrales bacterium]|nr:PEP/pyruvate-binding domain-containing protein [Candidatus Acidoferrales bacterium]